MKRPKTTKSCSRCVHLFTFITLWSMPPSHPPIDFSRVPLCRWAFYQVCFSLFKLLLHAEPREVILQNDYCIATLTGTRSENRHMAIHSRSRIFSTPNFRADCCYRSSIALYIVITEHLHAPNPAVRRVVNDALEVIIECGGQGWHDRIMEKRFEYHNREWLQVRVLL